MQFYFFFLSLYSFYFLVLCCAVLFHFSHVQLFVTLLICQAPLFMGRILDGLPCPPSRRSSSKVLSRSGKRGYACLVLSHRVKVQFLTTKYKMNCRVF